MIRSAVVKQKIKKNKSGQSESRRNVKITEEAFNAVPHLKNFAILAKAYFRKQAAFGSAFPPRAPVEWNEFILQLLKNTVKDNDTDNSAENYSVLVSELAQDNEDLFDKLCTFVSRVFFSFQFHCGLMET